MKEHAGELGAIAQCSRSCASAETMFESYCTTTSRLPQCSRSSRSRSRKCHASGRPARCPGPDRRSRCLASLAWPSVARPGGVSAGRVHAHQRLLNWGRVPAGEWLADSGVGAGCFLGSSDTSGRTKRCSACVQPDSGCAPGMKTAVSLPDDVCRSAERLAKARAQVSKPAVCRSIG
jgi:hypothetical protein